MTKFLCVFLTCMYSIGFTFQKISSNLNQNRFLKGDWILLDNNSTKPELFDECPYDNAKCSFCFRVKRLGLEKTFEKLFPEIERKALKNKKICYYKVQDDKDLQKIENMKDYNQTYDPQNDISFKELNACEAFCQPSAGVKCGFARKGEIFKNKIGFYCPLKKVSRDVMLIGANQTFIKNATNETASKNETIGKGETKGLSAKNETRGIEAIPQKNATIGDNKNETSSRDTFPQRNVTRVGGQNETKMIEAFPQKNVTMVGKNDTINNKTLQEKKTEKNS